MGCGFWEFSCLMGESKNFLELIKVQSCTTEKSLVSERLGRKSAPLSHTTTFSKTSRVSPKRCICTH